MSEKPSLKPKEVEKLLTETAADVSFEEQDNPGSDFDDGMEPEPPAPGYDFVSGWGRLNAYHAVSGHGEHGSLPEPGFLPKRLLICPPFPFPALCFR